MSCSTVAPVRARVLCEHGVSLYRRGRYQASIEAFREAERLASRPRAIRLHLARAYRQEGDLRGTKGQLETQRSYYKQALDCDPRLVEEASFALTYKRLQARASQTLRQKTKRPRLPYKKRNIGFGLGVTLGVEGLLGIQVGMLFWGIVNPLVTFSPVLQSLDVSLRIIPLRSFAWSPYVSLGVTFALPLERLLSSFSSQGPIIHGTIGVHHVAPFGLTFVTGLSFTYDFSPQLDTPFLPIPSVQLGWSF